MNQTFKKELQSLCSQIVELGKKEGMYIDCNYLSQKETRIVVDNETSISKDNDAGLKIRIYYNNEFFEYAYSQLNHDEIISKLISEIKRIKEEFGIQNTYEEVLGDDVEIQNEYIKEIDNGELKENILVFQNLQNELKNLDSDISMGRVISIERVEEHYFFNGKKDLYQSIPISLLIKIVFVKAEDGTSKMVYDSVASETLKENLSKMNSSVDEFKNKIKNYKKSKTLKGGKYKVVLSSKLSGLLAHESFGHGMEADTMLKNRALASKYLGKKLAKENVNIVDYADIPGKNGSFKFDHEGNLAKKTYLVKEGIIQTPMSDLYSSNLLGYNQHNNSRMESFDHKNYVRMSNTYFEPGTKEVEELISCVEDGILVIDSSGGMEDPKSWGVQIQGNFGQRIKNGKLLDEYYDGFALTGFLPDILKNMVDFSKDFEIEGGGSCGKGHKEWVRVSEGGPHILINEVILG